jgi:hypothetical protein
VRRVISLGSPFALAARGVDGSPGARVCKRLPTRHTNRRSSPSRLVVPATAGTEHVGVFAMGRRPRLAVPADEGTENVAVRSSHRGMGQDPAVPWVVADRLAQPRNQWQPFKRLARFGLGALFPAKDQLGT